MSMSQKSFASSSKAEVELWTEESIYSPKKSPSELINGLKYMYVLCAVDYRNGTYIPGSYSLKLFELVVYRTQGFKKFDKLYHTRSGTISLTEHMELTHRCRNRGGQEGSMPPSPPAPHHKIQPWSHTINICHCTCSILVQCVVS